MPAIPPYPKALARERVQNFIARSPSEIVLFGDVYKCRAALPSMARKAEIAGYYNTEAAMEVIVALSRPFDFRALNNELAQLDGEEYVIVEAQKLDGENCYNLTLAKV